MAERSPKSPIVLVKFFATTQPKAFAREQLGVLIIIKVKTQQILAGFVMAVLQGLSTHWNKLALRIGGATTFANHLMEVGQNRFCSPRRVRSMSGATSS